MLLKMVSLIIGLKRSREAVVESLNGSRLTVLRNKKRKGEITSMPSESILYIRVLWCGGGGGGKATDGSESFEGGGVNDVVWRGGVKGHVEELGVGGSGGGGEEEVVVEHESGGLVVVGGDLVVAKLGGQVGVFDVVGENDVIIGCGLVEGP